MTDIVLCAYAFAVAAHSAVGQRRKYTGGPYHDHPIAVSLLVAAATDNRHAVAAALMHDVIEDTQVDAAIIREVFGQAITDLVLEVTDVSRPEDGNRATRKALDRAHLAKASPTGQTIKVADLIDNAESITAHDADFARVYMAEKRALLEVLTKADPRLLAQAWEIVRGYEESQLQRALAR